MIPASAESCSLLVLPADATIAAYHRRRRRRHLPKAQKRTLRNSNVQTATPVLYRSLAAAAVVAMRNTRGVAAFWMHIIVRLSHLRELIILAEGSGRRRLPCLCVRYLWRGRWGE